MAQLRYAKHQGNLARLTNAQPSQPCVCVDLVKIQENEKLSDDLTAYISGSLLQAGAETTSSILVGFIQAMVIFPKVAKRAQMELDSVCGDRMPDLNDVPNLPYIRACAKETFRWMPGFMLGIPHSLTQNDTYMGYHIPKGSIIITNSWCVLRILGLLFVITNIVSSFRAIHNDPQRHPNPREFDPMRYIDDHTTSIESANSPDATKRDHFVFGAGRRRCQGMHIADRSTYLAISRLLWAFDFHRAIDRQTGQEIIPDMNDLTGGFMMLPNPFPADIRPRTKSRAETVKLEWHHISSLLDEQGQWKSVPEGLIWKDEQVLD
jgi:cytochrome P450